MYNFRMLNRRPLELPALDTLVPFIDIQLKHYTNEQVRERLRQLPRLLYNASSGWHFALSGTSIGKLPIATPEEKKDAAVAIHLSATANLALLVRHSFLGYSKQEPDIRINSFGRKVAGNPKIKFNHRFYVGAWINGKPYSVRLLIREYIDGTVELGEEAKAYALNIKEMRGFTSGDFSVFPASHGVTKALRYNPLIKDDMPGISAPSSRCEPAPPTSTTLTGTKIVKGERKCKFVYSNVPLQLLIEANLKEGEEPLYRQRATFDYSKTGTDSLETLFDRMGLRPEQRTALYNGDKIVVTGVRLHNQKTDIILYLEHGELTYRPYKP